MKINIDFFLVCISTCVYLWYLWYDRNHDMERYYLNHNKIKYKLVLYSKYVLMFSMIYNIRQYVMNYIHSKK
jgi:O-antigen/teichoic acid export membrane protein